MALGALIGAGTALLGGLSASKSAKQQARSLKEAVDFQRDVYRRSQEQLRPYQEAGSQQLGYLGQAAGAESPLYQMRMQDFLEQANAQVAARGQFFSPRAFQEIQSRGLQRIGAEEAEARWNRALQLAQLGQGAIGMGAGLGQGTTSAMLGAAQAQPQSPWPSAFAGVNQAVQGYLGNQATSQFLDRILGQGGSAMSQAPALNVSPSRYMASGLGQNVGLGRY